MEVIVTIVSKLVYFTYAGDVSKLLIKGWNTPFALLSTMDIPVAQDQHICFGKIVNNSSKKSWIYIMGI